MKLSWRGGTLSLREPFRGWSSAPEREAVWVELADDGLVGRGEVVVHPHQNLDANGIGELLGSIRHDLEDATDPGQLLRVQTWARPLRTAPGVRAAVDSALHDLAAQQSGTPVHRWIEAPAAEPASTTCTIGITTTARAVETATQLAESGFEVLKLKLGATDEAGELARVAAVREAAPGARILLDPNGAWSPEQTLRMLEAAVRHGVVAAEQPIRPGTPQNLAWVAQRSPVPIIADEDAADIADVLLLSASVHGINVKIHRCGGIQPALEIVRAARDAGLDVMLGCLVASSLGIAPAAHLIGHARWVDLDGHLFLDHDPWQGIGGQDGRLTITDKPGLGVEPVDGGDH